MFINIFDNANANTTTDDQGDTLVYDAWNRLVKVNSGNTTLEAYTYDGLGHRVTEQTGTDPVNYLFYSNQWQVIEEDIANSGLTLHSDYVWSPVFVDALILRDEHLGGSSGGSSFDFTDRIYAIQDANYNVTALVSYVNILGDTNGDGEIDLTDLANVLNNFGRADITGTPAQHAILGDVDDDGTVGLSDLADVLNDFGQTEQVVQRFVYDPYGNAQVRNADWTSKTGGDTFNWQYMYQGGRYDSLTGLYDFRDRLYSPTEMRWLTQDPMGYVNGANTYGFVMDNPINGLDPMGLCVDDVLSSPGSFDGQIVGGGNNVWEWDATGQHWIPKNLNAGPLVPDAQAEEENLLTVDQVAQELPQAIQELQEIGNQLQQFIGLEKAQADLDLAELYGYQAALKDLEARNDLFTGSLVAVGIVASAGTAAGVLGPVEAEATSTVADRAVVAGIYALQYENSNAQQPVFASQNSSDYTDITRPSSVPNISTNVTPTQFANNLTQNGWISTTSKDGLVTVFQNAAGAKYVVRGFSNSGPPTSDFTLPGSSSISLKIRLEPE